MYRIWLITLSGMQFTYLPEQVPVSASLQFIAEVYITIVSAVDSHGTFSGCDSSILICEEGTRLPWAIYRCNKKPVLFYKYKAHILHSRHPFCGSTIVPPGTKKRAPLKHPVWNPPQGSSKVWQFFYIHFWHLHFDHSDPLTDLLIPRCYRTRRS